MAKQVWLRRHQDQQAEMGYGPTGTTDDELDISENESYDGMARVSVRVLMRHS